MIREVQALHRPPSPMFPQQKVRSSTRPPQRGALGRGRGERMWVQVVARRRQGVTLIELMIVVVIISIITGAFGVSVRRTMLEQRMAGAAREIVRMARNAKLSASVLHVAHALRIDPDNARVRTLRAGTNSCLTTNWVALDQQCTAKEKERIAGTECISADFGSPPWSPPQAPSFRLRELLLSTATPPTADTLTADVRTICFSPNGTVYHGQRNEALRDANAVAGVADPDGTQSMGPLGGAFLFQLDLLRPGESEPAAEFVPRQVLVPLSGLAKVIR